ncbi:MAG TPA: hypothetical protein VN429_10435 [Methanospirillum sp.]|uniref:hypothetical protein n=1 Tax=Methanospirillum sp. TaxID=45200 RepID=UPI002B9BACF1|nr:hypothetical protein [Methanospirillum sp.]HWQ64822.1 hypothetical protein [Methanospirillum sp.]
MGKSKRSDATRECLQKVIEIKKEGFNKLDLPLELRQTVSHLISASYVKRDPDGKTDFILTSEGKRYAKLQGWV